MTVSTLAALILCSKSTTGMCFLEFPRALSPFNILFLLRIRVVSKGFHNDPIRLGRD